MTSPSILGKRAPAPEVAAATPVQVGKVDSAQTLPRTHRPKLGIFFSHPNQHHTIMFRHLAASDEIETKIYYFDPGLVGRMYDPGYGTSDPWDVDLFSGTDSTIMSNPLRGREVRETRQLNPAILSVMLRERFDAILLFGYVAPSNWMALALAKLMKVRVFYQSDANVLDERRKQRSRIRTALRDMFLRRVDTFLVIGDKNREAYIEQGITPDRLAWCPCPVDHTRFEETMRDPDLAAKLRALRQTYDIPDRAKVVAFCGKLIPRKRPQDVVEALRLLHRDDVYGLLIGSGEMEQDLRRSLTPRDRIRITGFINQTEIPYHMAVASVAVVASEFDAHPLVTTEFALCGLPVLVSDCCGVWGEHDILRPGENGDVYRCGDVQELSAKIRALLDDDSLRQKMGVRSPELARTQSAAYAADVIVRLIRSTSGGPAKDSLC